MINDSTLTYHALSSCFLPPFSFYLRFYFIPSCPSAPLILLFSVCMFFAPGFEMLLDLVHDSFFAVDVAKTVTSGSNATQSYRPNESHASFHRCTKS